MRIEHSDANGDGCQIARRRSAAAAVIAVALTTTLLAAPAAEAFTIGIGSDPDVAVDAAGTAYIAWNGPHGQGPTPLRFCRLPRAATVCDAGAASSIATVGRGFVRPFVAASGERVVVVQYRAEDANVAVYAYTSTNRGVSFGAGLKVGSFPFSEAMAGPGDTVSMIDSARPDGINFQSVPLDGSPDPGTKAKLSTTHLLHGTVGLIDHSTPLAVFVDDNSAAQFRRYDGSGPVNDVANWTAAEELGPLIMPKLAGGPSGLVLLASDGSGSIFARRWNGAGFGAPVPLGAGYTDLDLFQDAAGRLHAVYSAGLGGWLDQVKHAVSDDGVTWRAGTLFTHPPGDGAPDPRVATAADHIGVVVWRGRPNEVRVAALGPDAPVDPVSKPTAPPPLAPPPPQTVAPSPLTKPKPSLMASGLARRTGRRFRIKVKGQLVLPAGVPDAKGCNGTVKVSVLRAGTLIATKTVSVKTNCAFAFSATVTKAKVRRARKLAIGIRFNGNNALAPLTKVGSIRVKR